MTEGLERVWACWIVPVRPQSLSLRYRAASSLYTREPPSTPIILAPEGSNGEGSKSVKKNAALLHFLAFGPFDHLFGVLRGEQPLSRGSLPRNSETFFASFFGHKKGRTTGSMTLIRARRRRVAASGSAYNNPATPHPLRGTAYAAGPSVAARHLPTLWGVTPQGEP